MHVNSSPVDSRKASLINKVSAAQLSGVSERGRAKSCCEKVFSCFKRIDLTVVSSFKFNKVSPVDPNAGRQVVLEDPRLDEILMSRLQPEPRKLDEEESINLICELVKIGREWAMKSQDQDIVVILGNTGCGKSTFINWLLGAEMELVAPEEHKIPDLPRAIVRVKKKSKVNEIMKVGHSTSQSMTILSNSYEDGETGLTVYDCAGYNDTRGFEINISNNVNMRAIIHNADSCRAILAFNWNSL